MILASVVAKSALTLVLIAPVAVDPHLQWQPAQRGANMSFGQKDAAIRPLVLSATECIVRTVSADPRLEITRRGIEFNNLIVESVPSCLDALRSMIDAYDRLYGEGSGETFFMGPYLEGLPEAVTTRVKNGQ